MCDSTLKRNMIPTIARLEQSNRLQVPRNPVEMLMLRVNVDVKSRYTEIRRRPLFY
jgi:hypothetical protein